jgi:hypothetical protein
MKKFLVSTLATFVLVSAGSVFAQATAQHDVTVTIPEVVMLRFTSGTSNAAVTTNQDVEFDLTSAFADGLAGSYAMTNTPGWDDLRVFVNRASSWSVTMGLSNVVVPVDADWDWSEIVVTPSGSGLATNPFGLDDSGIVTAATARGWSSLGFGPQDFELTLDGTEVAGDYSATVTYTLTAP